VGGGWRVHALRPAGRGGRKGLGQKGLQPMLWNQQRKPRTLLNSSIGGIFWGGEKEN